LSRSFTASRLHVLPRLAARLFGFDYDALSGGAQLTWVVILALVALNGLAGIHDHKYFGGYDLRIRVVGARLLMQGIDPYTYSTALDLPPELRDPGQQFQGLSRCTYPPPLLLVYAPLSPLPYSLQRGVWMVLEWLALLSVIAIASRFSPSARVRFLTASAGLGLVAASYVWRFHVERGQYYVFIALLLALAVYLLLRCRRDHLGAGILLGLAVAMRPPVAILLLPLWLGGLRRTALGGGLTAAVCVGATLPLSGLAAYGNYMRVATAWEEVMLDWDKAQRQYGTPPREKGMVDGFRNRELELRGASWTVARLLNRPHLPAMFRTPAGQKVVFAAVLALWLGLFFLANRVRPFSVRETVQAGVWLVILTDYFLPLRVEYADVLYLLPVALAMPALAMPCNRGWLLGLVLAWLPVVAVTGPQSESYWAHMVPARGLVLLAVCGMPCAAAWWVRLRSLTHQRSLAPPDARVDTVPATTRAQPVAVATEGLVRVSAGHERGR
jgi:hypothetical protein